MPVFTPEERAAIRKFHSALSERYADMVMDFLENRDSGRELASPFGISSYPVQIKFEGEKLVDCMKALNKS